MTTVIALRRAEADIRHIARWFAKRSLQGAHAWLDAYEAVVKRLAENANSFPAALEDGDCDVPLRQATFHTQLGRVY
jgi:plasmid stabilization system protein ParE